MIINREEFIEIQDGEITILNSVLNKRNIQLEIEIQKKKNWNFFLKWSSYLILCLFFLVIIFLITHAYFELMAFLSSSK